MRHHVGSLIAEAKAANDKAREDREKKRAEKGGGKGKKGAARLDFSQAAADEEAQRPAAADRLLAALLVCSEDHAKEFQGERVFDEWTGTFVSVSERQGQADKVDCACHQSPF